MHLLIVVLAALAPALASAVPESLDCPGGHLETTTSYIGKDKNVRVDRTDCVTATSPAIAEPATIVKRQGIDECGVQCETYCLTPPSGTAPDPNDCRVIADALLYDSQNIGTHLVIPGEGGAIFMQFGSCQSFVGNNSGFPFSYCRTDWAKIIESLASECKNSRAPGGQCAALDQRWYIRVRHS